MALKQPPVRISAADRPTRRSRETMYCIGPSRQARTPPRQRILEQLAVVLLSVVAMLSAAASSFADAGAKTAAAAATDPATGPERNGGATSARLVNSPLLRLPNYSQKSDRQLTELGVRWDELGSHEQQALLREVKLRMAQRKDADGVLTIRTQRRYGRVSRSGERYIKIETRVVRVRPVDPSRKSGQQSFGVGFEQRTASSEAKSTGERGPENGPSESVSPPPVRAATPPLLRVNGRVDDPAP